MRWLIALLLFGSACATVTSSYVLHETVYFAGDAESRKLGTYDKLEHCKEMVDVLKREARQMNMYGTFSYVCRETQNDN